LLSIYWRIYKIIKIKEAVDKMNLTNNHLQIIREGLVKLECCSCQLAIRCHIQNRTYCQEISEWLREMEGENK